MGLRMGYQSVFVDESILEIHHIPDILSPQRRRDEASGIPVRPHRHSPTGDEPESSNHWKRGKRKNRSSPLVRTRAKGKSRTNDGVNFHYIHINCRQRRGSLFMVLSQVVTKIRPDFPERGYSANELLDILRQILDEEDTQILLCLDEVDALIDKEGSDALYYLTRFHETTPDEPRRLNLLCISKDAEVFRKLDRSTLSSLQRNVIRMPDYDKSSYGHTPLQNGTARSGKKPYPWRSLTSSAT